MMYEANAGCVYAPMRATDSWHRLFKMFIVIAFDGATLMWLVNAAVIQNVN